MKYQDKIVNKTLTFNLSEEEILEKARTATVARQDLRKKLAEFDVAKSKFKNEIAELEDIRDVNLDLVHEEKEERRVDCIERRNFESGEVEYLFNGEIMHKRPMMIEERQVEMPIQQRQPGRMDKDKMRKHLAAVPATNEQKEIRDVIREETSGKTKKNPLDT